MIDKLKLALQALSVAQPFLSLEASAKWEGCLPQAEAWTTVEIL